LYLLLEITLLICLIAILKVPKIRASS
jgi:hypothetical protein